MHALEPNLIGPRGNDGSTIVFTSGTLVAKYSPDCMTTEQSSSPVGLR